jgi:glycosyltransferase involved in cell wall biosynthesis
MNILYLTEFTSAVGGGGEVAFVNYAKEMGRRGHNVYIISHNSGSDNSVDATCSNLHSVRVGPDLNLRHGWFPGKSQQLTYLVRLLIEGRKVIGRNMIQVIHANTLSPAIAGSILGLIYKIPFVITVHHVESVQTKRQHIQHHVHSSWKKHAMHARYCGLLRLLCERAIISMPLSALHSVSRATAADLWRFGFRGRIEVIPNGLHIADYDVLSQEYLPFLMFVGMLVAQKTWESLSKPLLKRQGQLLRQILSS